MTTLMLRERGWRDGFWGREPREADEVYLGRYQDVLADVDSEFCRALLRSSEVPR